MDPLKVAAYIHCRNWRNWLPKSPFQSLPIKCSASFLESITKRSSPPHKYPVPCCPSVWVIV